MALNSGQIVRKPDATIDRNFFLPPNLVELQYKVVESYDDDSPITLVDETGAPLPPVAAPFNTPTEDGGFGTPADTVLPVENKLPVPGRPTLISETIRTTPGGNIVIDAVLEIPDIPGITEVDVRVSKVL